MKILPKVIILSALSFSLSFNTSASANSFEDGLAAYNKRDYGTAATNWRSAARNGHAEAQFNLGYMYQNGQGVERSTEQAVFWFQRAAAMDHAEAKTALERLGMNIEPEAPKAEIVQEVSVITETPPGEVTIREVSQGEFARIFIQPPIPTKPVVTERITAPPPETQTLPTPNPSFDDGSELFEQGIQAYNAQQYGPAFIFFRKASTKNNAKAQDYLGHLYFTGKGVAKSYNMALSWYHKAAAQGNIASQNQLALMYSTGRYGVKKSPKQAAFWYERAADLGDVPAMYHTGIAYYEGNGVLKDETLAIGWLKQAAEVGYEPAEIRLRFIALEQ